MASINEIDSRMKQEYTEFKELLKYMHECYDKMSEGDSDAVYEKDVIIGFGNRIAHAKGGAATYTALEDAITYILEQEYEEYEEEEVQPIGRIVKSYDIIYTGGGIYILFGFLNDGRFMCGEMPDDNGGCINVIRVTDEEAKALRKCMKSQDYTDDIIDEVTNRVDGDGNEFICSDNSKWMLMWKEVLDDYVKTDKYHAEKWMNAVYEEVAK